MSTGSGCVCVLCQVRLWSHLERAIIFRKKRVGLFEFSLLFFYYNFDPAFVWASSMWTFSTRIRWKSGIIIKIKRKKPFSAYKIRFFFALLLRKLVCISGSCVTDWSESWCFNVCPIERIIARLISKEKGIYRLFFPLPNFCRGALWNPSREPHCFIFCESAVGFSIYVFYNKNNCWQRTRL